MAVSESYKEYIADQLSLVEGVEMKKMFGGIGIFKEGKMFGMIGGDVFRLKADETNEPDFLAHGMKPYQNDKKKKGMPYWEVSAEVLEDKNELKNWAEKSFQIAINTKK